MSGEHQVANLIIAISLFIQHENILDREPVVFHFAIRTLTFTEVIRAWRNQNMLVHMENLK